MKPLVHFQTCYTSSTEGTIRGSIWKNQQPTKVFLHDTKNHKYWTAVSHYAYYRSFRNVMSAANGDDRAEWIYNEENFEVNYTS